MPRFPADRLILVLLLVAGCGEGADSALALMESRVEATYPDVRQIPPDTLARWLAEPGRATLLFDVREQDEFAVSHLRGARLLPPGTGSLDALDSLAASTRIVLYCSVGVRSSEMARRLQERGFTNVYNLSGSIFRWANEGRPVVRADSVVHEVHPYDAFWGRLLNEELRPREDVLGANLSGNPRHRSGSGSPIMATSMAALTSR